MIGRREFRVHLSWADDAGTVDHRGYTRDHVVRAEGKHDLAGSAAPTFRGDRARWNPEELLVAALSQCHLLSFLHVCAGAGVVVTGYDDDPVATLGRDDDGGFSLHDVLLRPRVRCAPGTDERRAHALHDDAHAACFIARSVAFPVRHEIV